LGIQRNFPFEQAYIPLIQEAEMTAHKHHRQQVLWPFRALWTLIATIVELTGRLVAMILGFVFILVGLLVSLTIIGAIIGIPLAIIGFMLVLRGIF
jgi:hypothetical protein